VLLLQCSDFVFHKHWRSFTKSSISGLWSPFHLKTVVGYFQTEQYKKKHRKPEKSLFFTPEEHTVTRLFTLFVFGDSSELNQALPLGWILLMNGLFTLFTFSVILPKWTMYIIRDICHMAVWVTSSTHIVNHN
jgi:hypothetical protein